MNLEGVSRILFVLCFVFVVKPKIKRAWVPRNIWRCGGEYGEYDPYKVALWKMRQGIVTVSAHHKASTRYQSESI